MTTNKNMWPTMGRIPSAYHMWEDGIIWIQWAGDSQPEAYARRDDGSWHRPDSFYVPSSNEVQTLEFIRAQATVAL